MREATLRALFLVILVLSGCATEANVGRAHTTVGSVGHTFHHYVFTLQSEEASSRETVIQAVDLEGTTLESHVCTSSSPVFGMFPQIDCELIVSDSRPLRRFRFLATDGRRCFRYQVIRFEESIFSRELGIVPIGRIRPVVMHSPCLYVLDASGGSSAPAPP